MPNVDDLSQSNFISKRDVKSPILVTIRNYSNVEFSRSGKVEKKWVLYFDEINKGLIMKPTLGQMIRAITNSNPQSDEEFAEWIGHKIVLYLDPNVISFDGKLVGGVRVRAPKGQAKPVPPPATFDRSKSIENLRAAQKAAGLRYDDQDNIIPENEPDPSIVEEPGADDEV